MRDQRLHRSNSLPDSLGGSIENIKNSDNSVKKREGASSSKNDLWQRTHREQLERQSLSPAKQAHSITEQTQKVADNLVTPQEALHRPDGWGQKDLDAVNILRECDKIATEANEIKKKEVYNYLPTDKRCEYEEELNDFHEAHSIYVNSNINEIKSTIDDLKYINIEEGKGFKSVIDRLVAMRERDFKNAIDRFNPINSKMREFIDFEEKLYNSTGQTLEKLSSDEHLSDDEIDSIKRKIASTAEKVGWKNFMERATEIIQKVNSDKCVFTIDAARESGDRSVEESLLKLASNENNRISIRTQSVYALANIGDTSTIEALEKMNQNQKNESMRLAIRGTCRFIRNRLQQEL